MNFAKFEEIIAKLEIKNLQNYKSKNFTATLLLLNLPSATHPPLQSARRFFNAVRQCYFEMKTNMELYFSILSSIILCILLTIISMHVEHRIIDDRMENYGAYIVFISK